MSVLNVKPEFLYPYYRKFPFDEVAEKIVRALEKRNWKVPNITVEFDTYGSGEAKYKHVYRIIGEDFKLCFSRIQGKLESSYNDTAALSSICIPKQSIRVYSDESGPTYYLYVGENWEEDKSWFMNSTKVNSKLHNEPRRYLKYKRHIRDIIVEELVSDTDLGREYSPIGDEPQSINLEKKYGEFKRWLEENVLNYILSFSEKPKIEEDAVQLIPYEGPWPIVYSICGVRDKKRILIGKKNPNDLPLQDRHAYFGSGRRLVYLCCKGNYPKVANEGFMWCDVNQEITKNSKCDDVSQYVRSEMKTLFGGNYIIGIKLKYANDVYVADNAIFEETRQNLFKAIAPRERLTDEELDEAIAARGATIIPITEYKGDYEEPMLLIARELDFDEIEWISED